MLSAVGGEGMTMVRLLIAFGLLAAPILGRAAAYAADEDTACNDKESTMEIVTCLDEAVADWNQVVDGAVATATEGGSPEYVEAVKAAQDLWLKYRDANCLTYRLGEGTIAAVEAAECRLRMTKDRARELNGSAD